MNRRFIIYCLALVGLLSCEDKQKQSQVKEENAKETFVIPAKISEEKKEILTDSITYPLITNENLVEFLTAYGKEHPETKVRINTQHGEIDIELYKDTPLHRANFIYLVKQEYFNGTFFHRIVSNFIIQGGNSDNITTPRKRNKLGKKYLIPSELKNGRKHKYGTVSGAKDYRKNPENKSVPFEFFIFLGPQSSTAHLNGNYTIFGKVTKGMDIVEKIANLPADEGDWPKQNVYIEAEIIE